MRHSICSEANELKRQECRTFIDNYILLKQNAVVDLEAEGPQN